MNTAWWRRWHRWIGFPAALFLLFAAITASSWHSRNSSAKRKHKITPQFKGDPPTATVCLGKPTGGEDRLLVLDARDGHLISEDTYADKPLLNRIHSGEYFGDGGLVFAMVWGLTLAVLTLSGLVIYRAMRRKNAVGMTRVFW